MAWLTLSGLLAFLYVCLQLFYRHFWQKIPVYVFPKNYTLSKGISVLIVAHNEEDSIGKCIESIFSQNELPPDFELIIIDDRSSDATAQEIRDRSRPGLRFFQLKNFPEFIHPPAYKKSGIELGIHFAKHEHIIVTDADCTFGKDWLKSIGYVFEAYNPVFIASPLLMRDATGAFESFQQIENLALMAITGAGIESGLHEMANGANMAFSKRAFKEVNGYAGNYDHASGDDMFLIEKMRKKFPDKILFLKSNEASAFTKPKSTWSSLIRQRIRWAGKNNALSNKIISRIWFFIGFYHFMMAISFISGFFDLSALAGFFILLTCKWGADYLLVQSGASFFRIAISSTKFITGQCWYFNYVIVMGWKMISGTKGDWDSAYSASGA